MNFQQILDMAIVKAPLPAFERDLMVVVHKLRHPMSAILARVPGETLAERARNVGVSRQTMYVWAQERFRPSTAQAAIIAELTGIPAEEIGDYQEGKRENGAGKTPRKTRRRVVKASRSVPAGPKRVRAKRGGVAAQQGKRGSARTVRKRSAQRPVGREAD